MDNEIQEFISPKLLNELSSSPPSFPSMDDGAIIVITVTFSKGEDRKEGSLQPGDTVKIKDGMVFNVTATDKS